MFRRIDHGAIDPNARAHPGVQERRKATHAGVLGVGTLACPRCDAPIDPGAGSMSVTQSLACPFCDARGLVRDFLSLGVPTRPARVIVRVALQVR